MARSPAAHAEIVVVLDLGDDFTPCRVRERHLCPLPAPNFVDPVLAHELERLAALEGGRVFARNILPKLDSLHDAFPAGPGGPVPAPVVPDPLLEVGRLPDVKGTVVELEPVDGLRAFLGRLRSLRWGRSLVPTHFVGRS
eukprot:TRINITY_DN475_c0_g2_i3.p3 TRINITY_DN475_c0_g2~~TRINITY_DN475_c0_g2_i3.p3  ORF type:complete len:140 (+),score=5.40 TRINITY_DN475_c0_g2_i3:80-499(+)